MKRLLIPLLAVFPLALGTASASADFPWHGDGPGNGSVPLVGTVVSTDSTDGSFVANVYVPHQHDGWGDGNGDHHGDGGGDQGGGGFGDNFAAPATTQVTITTDGNTRMSVNDASGTVADMSAGDNFVALFNGSPGDSPDTLVANPAVAVFDRTPPKPHQLYAFVGTVTGVDPTGGTVTVNVSNSLPSGLVPTGSAPLQFTVGSDTMILGGSGGSLFGGSLADVSVGDVVAGGLIGDGGETLDQVEATPLRLLVDFPSAAAGGGGTPTKTKSQALNRALQLLGYKPAAKSKSHKKSHGHKKSHSHKHARSHKHAHSKKHHHARHA